MFTLLNAALDLGLTSHDVFLANVWFGCGGFAAFMGVMAYLTISGAYDS